MLTRLLLTLFPFLNFLNSGQEDNRAANIKRALENEILIIPRSFEKVNIKYHILPYVRVSLLDNNARLTPYAEYKGFFSLNETHSYLLYETNDTNDNCFLEGRQFWLNIICDPNPYKPFDFLYSKKFNDCDSEAYVTMKEGCINYDYFSSRHNEL